MLDRSVVIYTSDFDPKSKELKEFLDQQNIEYVEKNVTKSTDYLDELQEKGIYSTPTIYIGDETILGLQFDRLKRELNILE